MSHVLAIANVYCLYHNNGEQSCRPHIRKGLLTKHIHWLQPVRVEASWPDQPSIQVSASMSLCSPTLLLRQRILCVKFVLNLIGLRGLMILCISSENDCFGEFINSFETIDHFLCEVIWRKSWKEIMSCHTIDLCKIWVFSYTFTIKKKKLVSALALKWHLDSSIATRQYVLTCQV